MTTTAKHAYRGTMKALQELGLQKDGYIETVDDVAARLKTAGSTQSQLSTPLPPINNSSLILSIDPNKIKNWELHDRPENELGDIEALANDLEENGQAQPCIVRAYSNDLQYDYELIVGERRWRAAKLRKLSLKIIVEKINDHQAAIYQIAENSNRKDLSDYAKGMNYYNLTESGIITQKELEKALGKNKIDISRLLSFGQIPKKVWDAIGNTTKISSRTASEIRAIIKKSSQHYDAIIQLAPRLGTGKLGVANLAKEVDKIISGENESNTTNEIRTSSGRHLFTWRKDSNGNLSISFPKDIRKHINKSTLENVIKIEIEAQLLGIDSI
jgi:ParB family chromosome partitioning protein